MSKCKNLRFHSILLRHKCKKAYNGTKYLSQPFTNSTKQPKNTRLLKREKKPITIESVAYLRRRTPLATRRGAGANPAIMAK